MPSGELVGRSITIQMAGLVAETMVLRDASLGSSSDIRAATSSALWRLGADFGHISVSRIDSHAANDQALDLDQRYLRARQGDAQELLEGQRSAAHHFAKTLLAERQLSGERVEEAR